MGFKSTFFFHLVQWPLFCLSSVIKLILFVEDHSQYFKFFLKQFVDFSVLHLNICLKKTKFKVYAMNEKKADSIFYNCN